MTKYILKGHISNFSPGNICKYIRKRGILFPFHAILLSHHNILDLFYEITFDSKYGIKTATLVSRSQLGYKDAEIQKYAFAYQPTPPYIITLALNVLKKRCLYDFGSETFIDYGCGAGRILIVAAEAGFSNVIGIELSPFLIKLCQSNIEKYSRLNKNANIIVREQNAADFIPPDNATVFYFYDPFSNDICKKVVNKIKYSVKTNPRPIFILNYGATKIDFIYEGFEFIKEVKQRIKIFKFSS